MSAERRIEAVFVLGLLVLSLTMQGLYIKLDSNHGVVYTCIDVYIAFSCHGDK